jgi:hypothetical protein
LIFRMMRAKNSSLGTHIVLPRIIVMSWKLCYGICQTGLVNLGVTNANSENCVSNLSNWNLYMLSYLNTINFFLKLNATCYHEAKCWYQNSILSSPDWGDMKSYLNFVRCYLICMLVLNAFLSIILSSVVCMWTMNLWW